MIRPAILAVATALAALPDCGSDVAAPPAPPATAGRPVAVHIAAGDTGACAVLSDQTTLCWGAHLGANTYLGSPPLGSILVPPVRLPVLADASAVAVGGDLTCALGGGRVACDGDPTNGSLGMGTTAIPPPDRPSWIPTLSGVVQIATTLGSACALSNRGTVECWGQEFNGELGTGAPFGPPALSPTEAVGVTTATKIVAGESHYCAQMKDGRVWCWGANAAGQLGDGTQDDRNVPTPSGVENAIDLFAGGNTACALNTSLSAPSSEPRFTCWGDLSNVPLSWPNKDTSQSSTPLEVPNLAGARQIAIGTQIVCALRPEGTVHCWGDNQRGELGIGSVDSTPNKPRWNAHPDVVGLSDAVEIAAGPDFACALRAGGQVVCWGANFEGQLGDGTTIDRSTPVAVTW
jgi:alpha-tubulin suppressor-like RCC1 family protein